VTGPVVFVGGIHGAGKSTISRDLSSRLSAAHTTASALIRSSAAEGHAVTVSDRDKGVPDVDANQALLLRGLRTYRSRLVRSDQPLVLDGHFCLLGATNAAADVPVEIFAAIAPVALVLVGVDPKIAVERLTARDGSAPSLATMAGLAERERRHAETVADWLAVPLLLVDGDSIAAPSLEIAAGRLAALLSRGVS
jgi:adenylate kinase